jgi:polysaccharide biosynthesis/export protein
MKNNRPWAFAIVVMLFAMSLNVAAQTPNDDQKARPRTTTTSGQDKDKKNQKPPSDRLEPDDPSRTPADVPDEMQANRHQQLSEEAAIARYYDNFFSTYRLGPEDVISVDVFNQDRYSRKGITVPPSGRISLSLIPGGVFVNGKTVDEVADIIRKRYDEYIIEPQVTVSLDKAASYRYSVIGDVGQPGIRLMNHRMTVSEAIAEAGGVLSTGDKSKVLVLRRQTSGTLAQIPVNLSAVYKGKAPDTTYLVPGDQIFVPGNKMKKFKELLGYTSVLGFARIFGVGF